MRDNYDHEREARAIAWADGLDVQTVAAIVRDTMRAMRAHGLVLEPYALMHDVCDPNQYLADATDAHLTEHTDFYQMAALGNRLTAEFDAVLAEHVHAVGAEDEDWCEGCGQLLCPDTGKPVGYDGGSFYWHLDGTFCFLHQVQPDEAAK